MKVTTIPVAMIGPNERNTGSRAARNASMARATVLPLAVIASQLARSESVSASRGSSPSCRPSRYREISSRA